MSDDRMPEGEHPTFPAAGSAGPVDGPGPQRSYPQADPAAPQYTPPPAAPQYSPASPQQSSYSPPPLQQPPYAQAAQPYATPSQQYPGQAAGASYPATPQATASPYAAPQYAPGQPYAPPRPASGLAITSLVTGIAGIVFSWTFVALLASIAAVITGHMALRQTRSDSRIGGRGMAIAGLVLGYAGAAILVFTVVIGIFSFLFIGGIGFLPFFLS
ncbi:DUF4190 domain-containing protein [Microbacterium paludicola]|uniref:DUF4190 domain-containing protein n=1 Tax=Microbacterium paludicola TaxID=300019 RepID=UPI00119DA180|nr:DUF4190 domain-containing protein [Microbacterium paludicola]